MMQSVWPEAFQPAEALLPPPLRRLHMLSILGMQSRFMLRICELRVILLMDEILHHLG